MKVIVVGAGAIGCSVAYHLAKQGAQVTVVERASIGAEASSVAAGILTVVTDKPSFSELTTLSIKSLSLFKDFVSEIEAASGIQTYYQAAPLMRLAADVSAAKELEKSMNFCRLAGVETRWVAASEACRLEPNLRFVGAGALLAPGESQIHSGLFTQAIAAAARKRGVEFLTESPVYGFKKEERKVTGVRLARQDLSADAVVLAAGSWSKEMAAFLSLDVAVEPVKGQILVAEVKGKYLRHIVYNGSNYLCQRPNGQFLLGTTFERAAFDRKVNESASQTLLSWASELLPPLKDFLFTQTILNFRPCTPDELPFLGKTPGWDGLWVAAGHYRKGIILAPLTGRLIAEAVLSGAASGDLKPFALERLVAQG